MGDCLDCVTYCTGKALSYHEGVFTYSHDIDEDREVNGINRVLIIELKRGGSNIGIAEKGQAEKYIMELYNGKHINPDARVDADVIICFNKALSMNGFPTLTREEYIERLGGNIDEIVSLILKDKNSKENIELIKKDYQKLYDESNKDNTLHLKEIIILLFHLLFQLLK